MGFTLCKMYVRKSKNARRYHSNQVAWERSANKDASLFRTSDILKLSNILKLRVNPTEINLLTCKLTPFKKFKSNSINNKPQKELNLEKVEHVVRKRWWTGSGNRLTSICVPEIHPMTLSPPVTTRIEFAQRPVIVGKPVRVSRVRVVPLMIRILPKKYKQICIF